MRSHLDKILDFRPLSWCWKQSRFLRLLNLNKCILQVITTRVLEHQYKIECYCLSESPNCSCVETQLLVK